MSYKMEYNKDSKFYKESVAEEDIEDDVEDIEEDIKELFIILRDQSFGNEGQRKLMLDILTSLHNSSSKFARKYFKRIGDSSTDIINDFMPQEEMKESVGDIKATAILNVALTKLAQILQLDEPEDVYAVILADAVISKRLKLDYIIRSAQEEMKVNRELYEATQPSVGQGSSSGEFNDRKDNPNEEEDDKDLEESYEYRSNTVKFFEAE